MCKGEKVHCASSASLKYLAVRNTYWNGDWNQRIIKMSLWFKSVGPVYFENVGMYVIVHANTNICTSWIGSFSKYIIAKKKC